MSSESEDYVASPSYATPVPSKAVWLSSCYCPQVIQSSSKGLLVHMENKCLTLTPLQLRHILQQSGNKKMMY